jgi:hypothetical protein
LLVAAGPNRGEKFCWKTAKTFPRILELFREQRYNAKQDEG